METRNRDIAPAREPPGSISPIARARMTASHRLLTQSFLSARSARFFAADQEVPSLPAMSAKVSGVGT
jgi:hypothetical protein